MKTIVLYESATGFTKQYAEWIAEALGCESKPLKQVTPDQCKAYDQVVFGGWVMANTISGLSKLKMICASPAGVFAVGATPSYDGIASGIEKQNQLEGIPFFYLEGGFHFDQLGFLQKLMLKMLKKAISKKANRSQQEKFMSQALGTTFDHTSRAQITPLVEALQA